MPVSALARLNTPMGRMMKALPYLSRQAVAPSYMLVINLGHWEILEWVSVASAWGWNFMSSMRPPQMILAGLSLLNMESPIKSAQGVSAGLLWIL